MALTIKAMEYFTTALRHGNIAKAATELNIAASAVATAIDQVEAEFDLTLVTRQRARGIQANASGREVKHKCERLLEEYRALLAEGTDLRHALSGTLRIGYYAPIAPAFLPQILDAFLPKDTEVRFALEECDNDQAQDGLLNGKYDVILFVAEDVRPAVKYDPLIAAPPYCLLPATHPLAQHATVSMAQIAQEPLIVLNRPVAASYYESLFGPGTRQSPVAAYANSTEMVRTLVAAGRGCAILNMRPLTSESYSGENVAALPISDTLPPLTLAIGYDKSRPRRIVQAFVTACIDHFGKRGPAQCVVEC
ncbi:LysR family transcriptional regulator [Yoonia sediminilitoris]|uniref:LysR family transcriptional regulator n=1 Tax=Yoonia sediminilitoris TaxID=1286148 RepID=A0A2T6KLF8_9RHOB|nr:LysR family transcriptional regulator [Yoonia sediminilitoris]PUB17043.1 LysR family transcriptional regulator [Yoonia sediminilitoris]RCW97338.1 LysR family transcriptional regulator [Yoonia sediminilitoris]